MRWVFVRPRNHSLYYDPEIQEPLGLECLSAFVRARGDAALLLDGSLDRIPDLVLARRIASFQPDAIGVSMTTSQELASVQAIHAEVGRIAGDHRPRWLAGGNFVTSEPESARRLLPAPIQLARFEGESVIAAFAQNTPDNHSPAERILCGAPVSDLDSLPFADRPYAAHILSAGWAFNVQGSRGCCGACRYCSSPGMVAKGARRWRGFSMQRILAELEHLNRQFGARSFNFIDEDFLGPNGVARARAVELVDGLAKRHLHVSFGIQVRPDSLTPEIIELLAKVGLTYVFMGIESSEPADLRRWGRPWKTDPWPLVDCLHRCGVGLNAGVMIWHPHATLGGVRRCAEALSRHGLLEYRSAINRLDAMPGSVMYREAAAVGQFAGDCLGPQPLPFVEPGLAELHEDVLKALAPLGPPSMHALCALPPLLGASYLAGTPPTTLHTLRGIIHMQDAAVVASFFAVLAAHEKGVETRRLIEDLRRENLQIALQTAQSLVACGLAASVDMLREAIKIDAGM
jgi:radical SAM superfamily enzyme YgiQ (UPF0313 family)